MECEKTITLKEIIEHFNLEVLADGNLKSGSSQK